MIKYINDGELESLKSGFYKTIALKKINLLDKNRFLTKEMDLDEAIKIYKEIANINFPSCYSEHSAVMLEYLFRNNLLNLEEISEISRIFYRDSDEDYDYGEYYDERATFVEEFLKEISSENGFNFDINSFRDILIYENEVDLSIYGDLRNSLINNVGSLREISEYDEDDWEEAYANIFQDDAFSHVLVGYEMNDHQLELLNKTFEEVDNGIRSEAYTRNGNTFITISGMQFLDGLNYNFIIISKLIIANKI
ncbi:hypothetical protein [uncultured Clostridium sp.]|uniref:hypothetical protein n=1 Tax=uncultured Clostridium sp. TaxID=59620 RepID=UPI0028EE3ABE|nr:hypothetical protein [uncultured Clostridium sp.]